MRKYKEEYLDATKEGFLNIKIISDIMRDDPQEGLENRGLFDEDKLDHLIEVLEKIAKYGWDLKIGKSDDCLMLGELRDYVLNRFFDPSEYTDHISECSTCNRVAERVRTHITEQQAQGSLDVLYRQAESFCFRMKDYWNTKQQQ